MTGKLLALFALWLFTAGAAAPVKMTMKQIADNVYFMEHPTGSSNAAFVVANDGVLVFPVRTSPERFVRSATSPSSVATFWANSADP